MSRKNKSYQTEDGLVWGSRSVAVVHLVMCVDDEERPRILITKRSETMTDAPGKWCLPCGYLDWDETAEDAAARELQEETGLEIKEFEEDAIIVEKLLVGVDSNPSSNAQNVTLKFMTLLKLKDYPTLTPNTEECSEAVWATGKEVSQLRNDFAFNHFPLLIEMVAKGLSMPF